MKSYWTRFTLVLAMLMPTVVFADSMAENNDPVADQTMKEINATAKQNLKEFSRRVGNKFGVPVEVVDILLKDRKMAPADAYMAINVAKTAQKPVEDVADAYERNKGKGWGAIAKEMGIKPGSEEFHQLKASSKRGLSDDPTEKKGKGKGKSKNKEKKKKGGKKK